MGLKDVKFASRDFARCRIGRLSRLLGDGATARHTRTNERARVCARFSLRRECHRASPVGSRHGEIVDGTCDRSSELSARSAVHGNRSRGRHIRKHAAGTRVHSKIFRSSRFSIIVGERRLVSVKSWTARRSAKRGRERSACARVCEVEGSGKRREGTPLSRFSHLLLSANPHHSPSPTATSPFPLLFTVSLFLFRAWIVRRARTAQTCPVNARLPFDECP